MSRRLGDSAPHCERKISQGKQLQWDSKEERTGKYDVCLTPNQAKVLSLGDKLGCGAFACAYDTKDPDKVVKITRDPDDVAALQLANEKKSAYVPKLHAAYQLVQGGVNRQGETIPVYAMVVERVTPVPREKRDDYNLWMDKAGEIFDEFDSWQKGRRGVAADVVERTCKPVKDGDKAKDCRQLISDVMEAYKDLKKIGINWEDWHAGNIGYDDPDKGALVIDLGISQMKQKPQAELLAGLRKALLGRAIKGRIK